MFTYLAGVVATVAFCSDGVARENKESVAVYSHHRSFRVPLAVPEQDRVKIAAVRLYVSTNLGASWEQYDEVAPHVESVVFRAERDAEHWLNIALVDVDGKQTPSDMSAVDPGLKIIVDRIPPKLTIKPVKSNQGHRGLKWEATDDHLNPASLRVAVWDKTTGWRNYPIAEPNQSIVWFEGESCPEKIQALIKDHAGNQTVEQVDVFGEQFSRTMVTAFAVSDATPATMPQAAEMAGSKERSEATSARDVQPVSHTSNSHMALAASPTAEPQESDKTMTLATRRVCVDYDVKDVGPSGIGLVVLWGTTDSGKTWSKIACDDDHASPVEAELPHDGTWGLMVVVSSGADPRERSPETGASADVEIAVDTVAPRIELHAVEIKGGHAAIRWTVQESARGARAPASIYCSPDRSGPWQPIAEKVHTGGEYSWNYAQAGLSGKLYFRIEVRDEAGNIGAAVTHEPVTIDSSRPKARVTNVQAAKATSG